LQTSSYLNLKGDEHVLDVATGTGYAAMAIAGNLPDGKVTGIDFTTFKLEHLAEAEELKSDKGIWLEMSVLYAVGAIGER
jgi:ubiquinone/menaquinone biosynthesis C-methylase UbiE